MTVQEIAKQALSLDLTDRAKVAEIILASIDSPSGLENSDLWMAEAERRKHEIDSGVVATVPLDEVFARLDRKFA